MYEFGTALKLWRESRRLSQDELADAVGAGKSYIGKVERGQLSSTIKLSTKERFWTFFECGSLEEFRLGPPTGAVARSQPVLVNPPMEVSVPVYRQKSLSPDWSSCGDPIMELHVHAPGRDLVAVLVDTAAMYPKIPRGSIVMVDRKIVAPEEGKIALFWVNGKAMIRRFSYAVAAGMASLQALDPEIAPVEVPVGMLLCMGVIYRVIADPNG